MCYTALMTTTLEKMLPAIRSWPAEDQEALAEAAREIEAARTGVYAMTPEEEAAVAEGLAQADRGEFAPDEEIAALWRRYAG
jgi:predicted transcriptional regulator